MSERDEAIQLQRFFETGFRRLRPHRLGTEILTLCREMAEEMESDVNAASWEECLHD